MVAPGVSRSEAISRTVSGSKKPIKGTKAFKAANRRSAKAKAKKAKKKK